MSVSESLSRLKGHWTGTNKLHTTWLPEQLHESEMTAAVSLKANGQFLHIEYTWEYEDRLQEGVMLIGCDTQSDAVQAIWTDSWHMSHKFMVSNGTISDDGTVNVMGHYSVPDHPDWGWRTELHPGKDTFRILMFNVSPEGEEDIAVEAELTRE
jgi:hypothetical protein